ncbi:MAG: dTDP-glucose 4,6-dehydratase [Candidatus Omnitrophica bacterium]|nr:dTDP-glucose 4,6-dehydratase [Candidatus Omnitrophota bacterium]
MNKKILVTGGAGFIGSEFVRQSVKSGYNSVVVDKLTYAGDLERLKEVKGKYKFYKTDICDKRQIEEIFKKENPQIIVNFSAETHVDRSIQDASPFVETNIKGTQVLLDAVRKYKIEKLIHISTDEVYGEIKTGKFSEDSPLQSNSPYAASKAAADLLIKAYIRTYNFPAIIIRPCNNYGPWQYPEKFIPVITYKALQNKKIPVYAQGLNKREWLYVSDCAAAINLILEKGKIGEIYNVGSGIEKRNIDVAKNVIKILGKSENLIQFVKDRPGHDFRYALDFSKICGIGWKVERNFEQGLKDTVNWYKQNLDWLKKKIDIA